MTKIISVKVVIAIFGVAFALPANADNHKKLSPEKVTAIEKKCYDSVHNAQKSAVGTIVNGWVQTYDSKNPILAQIVSDCKQRGIAKNLK